jgi:3-phenylpropionate/trans-cinnamate dioxygenase ferredoxin component
MIYYPAMRLSTLEEGQLCQVHIDGRAVLLVRIGEEIHAASNICPHAGSLLSQGRLNGTVVQCPMHGIRFSLTDGNVVGRAVCGGLPIYRVRVTDDMIEIAFPE